jgi:hypothetical protein
MSNIYVCCIARLEGRYIREFVEHYLNLGFTKVIICDNNHDGEDDLGVIKDYAEQGKVIIEDYRNQVKAQMMAYSIIYEKYKNECHAIMFVDVDEHLILHKHKNIGEFLASFPEDWEQILINWKCFNDNNLIHYDPRPLKERFTQPIPFGKCIQYANIAEDAHVKCIVRGGLPQVVFYSNPHVATNHLNTYHASGYRCSTAPWQPINWDVAQINHYICKTIEEYCTNKLSRGSGDRDYQTFLRTYGNRFFKYSEPTQEKLDWLKEHGYSGV